MNCVTVIKHKTLDMDKIKHYDKLLEYLCLDCEDYDIEKNEIETNNASNYKEITLQVNENIYILLHGFPGDAPIGCILCETCDEKFIGLTEHIKNFTSNNNDHIAIYKWYNIKTINFCSYEDNFWY
jgi:hypothetical protein